MSMSVFDIFKIGIGPSSSHTTGPMKAISLFLDEVFQKTTVFHSVKIELFGSLGLTGRAHGTDKAIILGLMGEQPETVEPGRVPQMLSEVETHQRLLVDKKVSVPFVMGEHLVFHRNKSLPLHPNGMQFSVLDKDENEILKKIYYSVGGGFVVEEGAVKSDALLEKDVKVPFEFHSGEELLVLCKSHGKSISQVVGENEQVLTGEGYQSRLFQIWHVMNSCIDHGLHQEGVLPGGLKVSRRAPQLYQKLKAKPEASFKDPLSVLDWVDLYAIAVNEENAAGGRVVTAPTNGAAGVVPAVLKYFVDLCAQGSESKVPEFLLTAAAIGMLFKENASISGAEVGCQGEVGVACSMAAAGLAAVLGGTPEQVENAAEIGMEHNLGLTCDPVGGLVQIPCIERNAMGAVKAINAARLALRGEGQHKISLDKVIRTMKETGRDMQSKYKETSQGGLATNFIEC